MLKLAIKNMQRNRKRTFLTVLTIFFAALVVGLAQGWVNGALDMYLNMYIDKQTGHVRVASEEFIKREKFMPVDEPVLIENASGLVAKLEKVEGITSVEPRVRFGILLSQGNNTVQAVGVGLDLQKNRYSLKNKMVQGALTHSGIYLGEGLAQKLGISQGEEILIASKTSQGGLNGIKLKVEGIFKLGNGAYDRKFFFLSLADAQRLLKMNDRVTEIIVYGEESENAQAYASSISSILPQGLKSQDYMTQLGDLYVMISSVKIMYLFIEALILFLASFVIVNTMMMNIYERIREIGTIKALGMTDREVFWSITVEGAVMGAIGGIAGGVLGYLIIIIAGINGINMESMVQGVDMAFDYVVRPELSIGALGAAVALCIVVPALAAMIPARHSNKLMPAEALRK